MDGVKQPYSVKYYREVKAKKVEWLWYPYIPYGKITIIQGDPGEGKSTVAINLASIISNGEALPLEKEKTDPRAVVYQNSEDGKAVNDISCKTGYTLCDNEVIFTTAASLYHFIETISVL